MSRIQIDLEDKKSVANAPSFGVYEESEKAGKFGKVLKIFAGIIVVVLLVGAIGGFFYWSYLKNTPQYSLALLVEAARNDNQKAIDDLVDVDAIVEDFVPQIIDNAVELYARGFDEEIVKKALALTAPILPVVKQRAKAELPGLIREKTKKFEDIPFWAIAIGASQYLDIKQEGDKAFIKSKLASRPLEVEMKQNGDKWQIVALKDEQLARRIAGKIGQEIIGLAKDKGNQQIDEIGKDIGLDDAQELLKKAKDIFKK